MLGGHLEIAISADPLIDSLEFYRALGFQSLPVGDSPHGPNAVLWNGSLTLGLYAAELEGPVPTFVRPDLKMHLRALRRLGIELEFAELADDEFHRAAFADPNGRRVLLVEARTFSPAPRESGYVSALGRFLELSISTHSAQDSAAFWESLGFELVDAGEEPHSWCRLAGHGLAIGFYEAANFGAALAFSCGGLEARLAYLDALGVHTTQRAPIAKPGERAAMLIAPEGTPIYLIDETHTAR